jgi:hypothetical protein
MSMPKKLLLGLAVAAIGLSILFQFYVFYLLIDARIHLPGWGGFAIGLVIFTGLLYLVAPATVLALFLAFWFTRKRPDFPGARGLTRFFWAGTFFPLLTWAVMAFLRPG